jgi:hypothetical protein
MLARFTIPLSQIIILLLISPFLHAEDLWLLTDARFAKNNICESYINGATYKINHESCTRLGCDKWQYLQKTYCSSSGARIDSVKMDGSVFSRQDISVAQWQETHGNLLRSKAAYAESFGNKFDLLSVQELPSGELTADYSVSFAGKVIETGTWILAHGPAIPTVKQQKMTKAGFLHEVTTDTFIQ